MMTQTTEYTCDDCGSMTPEDHGDDHITLCKSCWDSYYTCDDCGALTAEDYGDEDVTLCESCLDSYYTCDECDCLTPEDHGNEEMTLCRSCRHDYYTCDECGALTPEDHGDEDVTLCESCRHDYYMCDECDCLTPEDHGDDHITLCASCAEEAAENPHNMYNHSHQPDPVFFGTGPLYFGIELEMEKNGNVWEGIESEYLYAKYDSSLDDGVEIVSHPASWSWLTSEGLLHWRRILDLRKAGYRSYDTNSCGMHVHMSRSAFSTFHLYKWLQFFYQNPQFILDFSRRRPGALAQWASINGPSNISDLVLRAKSGDDRSRYEAINLRNASTIEIRIFRGTLNPSSFWRNLEFLRCLYEYTAGIDAKHCRDLGPAGLVRFAHDHRTKFPNFSAWCDKRDMAGSIDDESEDR